MNDKRGGMAPVDVTLSEKHSDRFQLVNYSKLESAIPVYKYKCLRTGITIVFGDIEGPLVQGYFTLGNILVVFLLFTNVVTTNDCVAGGVCG